MKTMSTSSNPGGSLAVGVGVSPTGTASLSTSAYGHRSTWQSPVPYLFGGLAAMLALIAFGLLILACSYRNRRHSGARQNPDLESGGGKEGASGDVKSAQACDDKILVIMAGEDKPTYVATPLSVSVSANFSPFTHATRNDFEKKEDENSGKSERQPCPN